MGVALPIGLRISVGGGFIMSKNLNMTVVLDLSTMVLSPGPRMTALRFNCATAILDATRLFVTGGTYGANSSTYLKTTEMLDFDTMTFTPGPHMTEERRGRAACRADGDFAALRPLLAELGLAPIGSAAEASEQRTACCNAYAAEAQTGAHQAVEE